MYTILIISIVIVVIVLLLSVFTISKGYSYKHTIDPAPNHKLEETFNSAKEEVRKEE